MPIEGKVALIIDERHIVLNRGREHGVRSGMPFAVVSAVEPVTDPDTGEELGRWEGVKARLAAVHVQEKLSILSPAGGVGGTVAPDELTNTLSAEMVRVSMTSSVEPDLDVDRGSMQGMPHLGPIKVGDVVRQVE